MNGDARMHGGLVGMFLLMLMAPAAWAQTGKHVALGGAIGVSKHIDDDFSFKNPGFAVAYRINPRPEARDGWRWAPKGGLGWSNRKTSTDIGGISTPLGKLQTILIMAGVQRALRQGPWQLGFGVVAGPSFNSFKVDRAARDAYQNRLGRDLTDIKAKNYFAIRPEFNAFYDLNKWFAVQGSLSYLYSRPRVETTLDGVTTSSRWKTDHADASIGLVVGIF